MHADRRDQTPYADANASLVERDVVARVIEADNRER
jgi:hypothetical protein